MSVFLDWTRTGSAGDPAPCVICGHPAICRSPKGVPCHKVCAEQWIAQHGSTDTDGVDTLRGAA
ncbi:hypothetical protein V6U90_01125 [Micromonospora sp. CPCC 206060]|uniref:hypothetical protein n=1 Tax=Micromonospora sp. CPCC 206060 TaxID=3122406 RepID=UPI002FF140CD